MATKQARNRNVQVMIYFDQELLEKLDQERRKRGVDRSPLVRDILREYLDRAQGDEGK